MRRIKLIVVIALAAGLMACSGAEEKAAEQQSFEELGNNAEFKEKHVEPDVNKEASDLLGEMIKIDVEEGEEANAYVIASETSNVYVLVFHEWWGLNDYVKEETDNWHERLNGVNMIALDLYDGKVAEVRDSAQKYMQSADPQRMNAIIEGALSMIPENARIGTIGWCFGGGWSLRGSIAAAERAEACVMYYGMPEQDQEVLSQLETDVLFIYGQKDKWINEEVANQFVENMKAVDADLMVKAFDADHAFANPTQANYNEGAAQEANAIALEFFKEKLLGE